MNRSLDNLNPEFKRLLQKFMIECEKSGVKILVYNTLRKKEEQYALYLQGRAPIEKVNEVRKIAGLPPISSSENRVVTNLKDSPHCHGLAADFVPVVDGKAVWNDYRLWAICGKIAESVGLEWGGSWKDFPDYPHLQMKNWRRFLEDGR
ncbi:M15 family metallopeptidase [Fervidobacterium gondwanense]|uniref:M15 family metallopeptidase n=1 Tax=Fervidobacterium gondwanense TaxID=44754 RepID=UPI003C728139